MTALLKGDERMEGKPITITVKLSSKGQIVIPKRLRDILGIRKGSKLLLRLEGDDRLTLIPANRFGTSTRGMVKGTFGETLQEIETYMKEEREGWEKS